MTAVNVSSATGRSKLYSYWERKPENYDVSFAVGPQKISVKALKVILKSSSTVFEKEFDDKWEVAVLKEGEGISLPDLNPEAFKLFIKLMITDTWSIEALKELKRPANQLLNLLSICIRYEIANGVESLKELLQEFLGTFGSFIETDEFLNLSRFNLQTLLSSEDVICEESKIFEGAYRWAEKKCIEGSMETNGKNYRDVLGPALFQIRFPIMTNTEFTKAMRVKNILTADEIVQIFMYIGMDEEEKINYDLTNFPFNTQRRSASLEVRPPAGCSTLCTKSLYSIDSNTPFVCDGKVTSTNNYFIIDKAIAVYGVGFLGPIDADAYYDVTVEFKAYNNGPVTSIKKEGQKTLFASKGKVFYFNLDEPLSLQKNVTNNDSHRYIVEFSLKGPNTPAFQRHTCGGWKTLHEDGVFFKIIFDNRQMPEIIFKKV